MPDQPAPVPTMTVLVCDRSNWSTGRTVPIVKATIPAVCPTCGGPRGRTTTVDFQELVGVRWRTYHVHQWRNPCGHVDLHQDVLVEARAFARSQASDRDERR